MFCHFPVWRPGLGVVLDCIDSRSLSPYFAFVGEQVKLKFSRDQRNSYPIEKAL